MTDLKHRLETADPSTDDLRAFSDEVLLVMGWQTYLDDTVHWRKWADPQGNDWSFKDEPHPAASVDDALALLPGGWCMTLNIPDKNDPVIGILPRVVMWQPFRSIARVKGYAPTLALAICAALVELASPS